MPLAGCEAENGISRKASVSYMSPTSTTIAGGSTVYQKRYASAKPYLGYFNSPSLDWLPMSSSESNCGLDRISAASVKKDFTGIIPDAATKTVLLTRWGHVDANAAAMAPPCPEYEQQIWICGCDMRTLANPTISVLSQWIYCRSRASCRT